LLCLALNQRDEFTLGLGIALDIVLRHGEDSMPGKRLVIDYEATQGFKRTAGNKKPALSFPSVPLSEPAVSCHSLGAVVWQSGHVLPSQ
jgi:hypothetical protein